MCATPSLRPKSQKIKLTLAWRRALQRPMDGLTEWWSHGVVRCMLIVYDRDGWFVNIKHTMATINRSVTFELASIQSKRDFQQRLAAGTRIFFVLLFLVRTV